MSLPTPVTWNEDCNQTAIPIQMDIENTHIYHSSIYQRIFEIYQDLYIQKQSLNSQYTQLALYADSIKYILYGSGTDDSFDLLVRLVDQYGLELTETDLDVIYHYGIDRKENGFITNMLARQFLNLAIAIREKYYTRRSASILQY